MRFMDLISHVDDVLDQLGQDLALRSCIKEESRVDIDLEKNGIELAIKHKVEAKHLEATESAIEPVLCLQEDETHDFVDAVRDTDLIVLSCGKPLLHTVVTKGTHCHSNLFLASFKLWMLLLNG